MDAHPCICMGGELPYKGKIQDSDSLNIVLNGKIIDNDKDFVNEDVK